MINVKNKKPQAPGLGFIGNGDIRTLLLRFDHLSAAVHPRFQIDVMRAVKFTGLFVFDIGFRRQSIMGAAHATLGRCRLTLGDSHGSDPYLLMQGQRPKKSKARCHGSLDETCKQWVRLKRTRF